MPFSFLSRRGKEDELERQRSLKSLLLAPVRAGWRKQKTISQEQCPLFRLPFELRQIIYTYAFVYPHQPGSVIVGGTDIHIFRISGKWLCHRRCCSFAGPCIQHCYRYSEYGVNRFGSLNLLALLLTCRWIYNEAVDVLYSQLTFKIRHIDTLISFTSVTPPERLKKIQVLHFHWRLKEHVLQHFGGGYTDVQKAPVDKRWNAAWKAIAEMNGLRELHVRLCRDPWLVHQTGDDVIWGDRVFDPMLRIQGLERFEVEVNWKPNPSLRGPFRVVRNHRRDDDDPCTDRSIDDMLWDLKIGPVK